MATAPAVPDTPVRIDFVHLLEIVRGEYLEMPCLRLTRRQAQRLWALDSATCDRLLDTLERTRFLARTPGGDYVLGTRSQ